MIERYTRKDMGRIWSAENRFGRMLEVEQATAVVLSQKGWIPALAGKAIQKKGKFSVKEILKLEEKTRHDVSAFVQNVSSYVGDPWGKYVHYGLTSSDVLDTALSLQIQESAVWIQKGLNSLKKTLENLIQKHKADLCAGRTHGIHAEPTTFGFKLLGFLFELCRAEKSFLNSVESGAVGVLSGPVGVYSSLSLNVEKEVCRKLGLQPEDHSTQVAPRDRHVRILFSLTLIVSCLERIAVELRHLQRTEVGEVYEGFSKKQQGSSSMPHKKNPISSENITGLARLLRSYLQAVLENTALWHERDISHSSVERVVFPDAFILCDYALDRMTYILTHLQVDVVQMKENLLLSGGNIFSSQVLSALIQKGVNRQTAYTWVQKAAHHKKTTLQEELWKNVLLRKHLTRSELTSIFSGQSLAVHIKKLVSLKLKKLQKFL